MLDAGGYASSTSDYAAHMCKKITKLYRIPYYHHRARAVYTNTPVAGAMRGWGAPEIVSALEIHMDLVARELGMDPVDLRMRNLMHPFDVDPTTEMSLGDARVRECLERGAEAFDWRAQARARPGRGAVPSRRGRGLRCPQERHVRQVRRGQQHDAAR